MAIARDRDYASLLLLGAILATPSLARAQYEEIDACIDASEKALALNKAEKLIDERKALSLCAASSCPDAVKTSCRERLAEVIRAIPTIIFVAKDRSGRDLPFVQLSIDGAAPRERLDGSAIKLDPGDHEFRFEVAGEEPVVVHFVLHQSEQDRRETIIIGAAHERSRIPQRSLALALGGVGVAGLAIGAVFGALSLSAHDAYEQSCGQNVGAPAGQCDARAVPGERDAANKGTIATAFLVGGGIATAIGALWYLLAPESAKAIQVGKVAQVGVAENGIGLAILGRF